MYVCGITPYDTTHLGHAYTYVFFDTLFRFLTHKDYKVNYVQNVTDIDDDILKKAKEKGLNWKELGDFWTKKFLDDMKSLNVLPSTHYVKATDSIALIIHIIEVLIKKDFAYEKEGNVYFDINKFKRYGELSHYDRKQMILLSKDRGADPNDPLKKDPLDFILWQKSKTDEPSWESPWKGGRPGWHIECSAVIHQHLGDQIDIHGGGRDLIFPHHESEIAQSEAYCGKKPFVKYWLHTSMVMYEGEKMAKSLGNLVMVSDLLKKYSANVVRLMLLSHHYREPWEFDEEELKFYDKELLLINEALKIDSIKKLSKKNNAVKKYLKEFEHVMNFDLNTPSAILIIKHLSLRIIRESKNLNVFLLQETLKTCLNILGIKY